MVQPGLIIIIKNKRNKMLSGIQTYELYVMKSFYSGSYSHSCTDLLKKNLTFIHFPLRLLWLNQKEVSGLRELKAVTLFPLWRVTWFPFVPWKTSWFWLFSLSGMRYNSTPAAKSPVSHRKLLHFGPSPSVQLGGLFHKELFYYYYLLFPVVWGDSSNDCLKPFFRQ